jgi:hypothetical protein
MSSGIIPAQKNCATTLRSESAGLSSVSRIRRASKQSKNGHSSIQRPSTTSNKAGRSRRQPLGATANSRDCLEFVSESVEFREISVHRSL